ncbi:hypothetical protein FNH22_31115 [Fulvivirga sp. M361]|uniref:hypothetical protein n=1 Tax=Fulvivirga sp. M361 TaxID=2594266 RepID=UPI00117A93EC|nr:hypothetical protein [Fulvivirga sp. M361]TRX46329.1 hypothetical protein FNH22_31115 [Fulvivirga sp. M361]
MEINVALLTTAEECDTALEILQAEKTQLQRRLRNLGERLESRSATTVDVSEGIVSVQAILKGYQAAVDLITDEKAKRELELKIEREETKLKALQNRQANYNAVSVVEDQVDHTQLEAQLPVLDDAITMVETHKGTL